MEIKQTGNILERPSDLQARSSLRKAGVMRVERVYHESPLTSPSDGTLVRTES